MFEAYWGFDWWDESYFNKRHVWYNTNTHTERRCVLQVKRIGIVYRLILSPFYQSRSVTWWQNYVTTERIAESFCWFESQRVGLSVGAFKCCLLFPFKDDSVKMWTVVKERIHTVTKYDLGKRIQLVLRIISWTGSFSQRKPDPKYMTSCDIPERAWGAESSLVDFRDSNLCIKLDFSPLSHCCSSLFIELERGKWCSVMWKF